MGLAQTLPRGERGGENVKGESEAALDIRRGQRPPNPLVQNGGEAADLINTAQVTPHHMGRIREAKRRAGKVRRRHRLYDVRYVRTLAASGFDRGFEAKGPLHGEWNLAPSCENPVPVQFDGAPRGLVGGRYARLPGRGYALTLYTKCRRCGDCLRRRRSHWAYRAQEEIRTWSRTWFATFTFAPHWHAVMRMRASRRLADRGTDFERLPGDDLSQELSAEYRRELTLYFKRLRKQSGAMLRYILVQEQHKSGLPHFHALIHEVNPLTPIRHATLTAQWKLGYTKFKLCEGMKSAWYVAKYLAKAVDNRVRASLRYGLGNALKHSGRKANVTNPGPAATEGGRCQSSSLSGVVCDAKSREAVAEFTTPEDKLHGLRWLLQRRQGGSTAFEAPAQSPLQAPQKTPRSAEPSGEADEPEVPRDQAAREAFEAAWAVAAAFATTAGTGLWNRSPYNASANRDRREPFRPVSTLVRPRRV